jgi:CRP/FNR family cyclic AMP-dependent transcriptional regulator
VATSGAGVSCERFEGTTMDMHQATTVLGFIAGALYIASHYMKTMVPLRLTEIGANMLFIVYGAFYPSYPTLALYGILIALNSLRLYEMLELIKKVREASQSDLSIEWLKPFMHKHVFQKGQILFHKGEAAEEMYFLVSGRCRIKEIDVELQPGTLVGELGYLTPDRKRTQTIECLDEVHAMTITYDKLTELYFQNPSFGIFFLKLTSQRLLQNVARMEQALEARRRAAPA